ncbi:Dystroglycan-type cadherin domain protein [Roseiflexus castenholzii DSM 13941]|uniref:Dystroglycan-type cadherin domain protein n=2 Tax=Roseiflexus castenholzii TaxID=120962 RepID=A7NQ97_ROSCS|nr:Dystroglycan-type cadherin domain protein [Roseiflexus castenholzii DSM 13941]
MNPMPPGRITEAKMHKKLTLIIVLMIALLGVGAHRTARGSSPTPSLADAQRQWDAVEYYRFSATLDQERIPIADVTTVGQVGQRHRFYLSGQSWPAEQRMEASLWTQGGNLLTGEGKIDLRLENGHTWIRTDGEWEPLDDFSAAFAPQGDWLALLTAAQETIVPEGRGEEDEEDEAALHPYTRHPYRLDGARLARALQEWTVAALTARGELPPGAEVELPAAFRNIAGMGELWVDEQGLPVRNTLTYDLPGENGGMTRLTMQVDFSDVRLAASPVARALGVARLPTAPEVGTCALSVALVALGALVVARRGRSPRIRTVVSVLVITSTLFGPLAQSERAVAAAERRQATQARQQAQQARAEAMTALQETLAEPSPAGRLAVAGISPLESARSAALALSSFPALPFSPSPLEQQNPNGDDDGDGLTNAEEERLGTLSITVDRDEDGIPDGRDSDNDGISDYDEVTGFFYNGRWWYGDPLLTDTNNDGLPDGLEWGVDTDNDGTPDLYDDDNDGDGVPDRYDLSPFSKQTTVFSQTNPLAFSVANVTAGKYLYVEYQLRPTNPNHLWYALTTRDWPRDEDGQMQDRDGKTFQNVNPNSTRPQDAYGDVRLAPMLEIHIPGTPSQLVTTNNPSFNLTLREYTDPRFRVGTPFTGTVTLTRSNGGEVQVNGTVSRAGYGGGVAHELALYSGTCERPETRLADLPVEGTEVNRAFNSADIRFDSLFGEPRALLFYEDFWNNFNPRHLNANYACADIPALLPFESTPAQMANLNFYQQYGIGVNGLGVGKGRSVYVPLQLISDPTTGAQMAFQARMIYRPQGGTWGAPHQVRLVWAVIGLNDSCNDSDCTYNETQVLMVYPDAWQLTGLNVREDHGVDAAIIYEDPAVDPDRADDRELTLLTMGLEEGFLSGRDCTLTATGACQSDGQRDITVGEIYRRFDRDTNGPYNETRQWAITDTLQVETHTYAHLDAALEALASTDVAAALSAFDAYRPITPTLLFATEERFRLINLQSTALPTETQAVNWNGAQVTVDFASPSVNAVRVHAGLKWAPYRYNAAQAAWQTVSVEDYWQEIERRYPAATLIEPDETQREAEGKQFIYQLYYLALYKGVVQLVQVGDQIVRYTFAADTGIVARIIKLSGTASSALLSVTTKIGKLLVEEIGPLVKVNFVSAFRVFGDLKTALTKAATETARDLARGVVSKVQDALGTLGAKLRALSLFKGLVIVGAVLVVVFILVTVAAVFITSFIAAQLGGPTWTKVVAGVGLSLITSVVYMLIKNVSLLIQIGKMLYAIYKTHQIIASLTRFATAAFAITKAMLVLEVIGLILQVAARIAFLLYVYLSGTVAISSVAGHILLAETVADIFVLLVTESILLALIIAGLGAGPQGWIFGAILAVIGIGLSVLALIDLVATALCQTGVWEAACHFSIAGSINSFLRRAFYRVGVVTETGNDLLNIRGIDLLPVGGAQPMLTGGSAVIPSLHLRHWAKTPRYEDVSEILFHEYLASAPNETTQRGVALRYALGPFIQNVGQAQLNEMRNTWGDWHSFGQAEYTREVRYNDWRTTTYRLYALRADRVIASTQAIQLTTGLNRQHGLWLSTAFALPTAECWLSTETQANCSINQMQANQDFPINLVLDVLPPTLDEFVAWTWDPHLPPLRDGDGDGLLAAARGGNDPNDALWDSDGDGISDLIELRWQQSGSPISPTAADTDGDGLSDAEELRLGADLTRADTDGDGLTDFEEVRGWTFTYSTNPTRTTLVTSNPLIADSDGDGISDRLERTLHLSDPAAYPFHPQVYNPFGLAVTLAHNDADGYLARGQSLAITATVRNTMDQIAAQGTFTLTRPTDLGGGATVWTFGNNPALAPGAQVRVESGARVALSAPTQVTALQAALRATGINPDGSRLPGDLTASAELTVTVDADTPTAAITWPTVHAYLPAGRSVVIGGTASDPTSYIARVEARADNGAWQTANGRERWSAAVPIPAAEGIHTLWVRATDAVGNVQSAASQSEQSIAVYADGTPPSVNAVIAPYTVLAPIALEDGRRQLVLRFTAADPNLPGSIPGSGVDSVEMDLRPYSAGWQAATRIGSEWVVTYTLTLPAADADGLPLLEPNGVYTALVRAADTVGNVSDAFAFAYQVDGTAPRVEVQQPPRSEVTVISDTLVLYPPPQPITGSLPFTGTVYEMGDVRSGVQSLDVRLTPADLGVAPGLWRGRLYDRSGSQTTVYTVTPEIDVDWGVGAPAPGLTADHFIAEWQQEALFRVPGVYTLTVTKDADSTAALWVDGALRLSAPDGQTSAVLTLTLGAGVHPLRLRYNEATGEARLRFRAELAEADWQAVTLAQSGAGVLATTWEYTPCVAQDSSCAMEGLYRLDARAADVLGNALTGAAWRGEIDTAAPRIALDVSYTGVGSTAQTHYRVWVNDFNLVEEGLQSPCPGGAAALRPYYYDTAWWREIFGETTRLYQLYGECSVPGYVTTPPTVTAYDRYGHVATLSAPPPEPPNTRGLYWNYSPNNDGALYRLDLNTAAHTHLLDLLALGHNTLYSYQNLKVHPHSERLYAALPTASDDRIWRLGLDGSDPEQIITRTIGGDIRAIALTRDHLYWLEAGGTTRTLLRANLDGSDVVTLTTALSSPVGLAADPFAGVVFVAENVGGRIRFYAESGESGYMDPIKELGQPIVQIMLDNGMAVDPQARMLYVAGERTGSGSGILRIPYPPAWSGAHTYTEATLVVPSNLYLALASLAVDSGGGKLYFATLDGSGPYTVTLRRANLDGSDLETVHTAPDHLFWSLSLDLDINHPPTTTAQIVQVAHNTPTTFTLEARDPNANPLTFTLLDGPEGEINLAATATYTPTVGFAGQDRFTYRVEDNRGAGATGEVILNVWPAVPVFAAVNAPADNTIVAPGAVPITVSGYALHEVYSLTLSIDDTPAQTWTYGPGLTEASETHTWTAAAGLHTLRAQVRDRNGDTAESAPVRVIVDATPPTVTVAPVVYTSTHALSGFNAFMLTGSAGDDSGIARVEVVEEGATARVAQLDANPCPACGWQLAMTAPAGATPFTITIRATDLAGQVTIITPTLTVDLFPPEPVTVTLAYTDSLGQRVPLSRANPVVREANRPLIVEWDAASDGSGIEGYYVGWTSSPTVTVDAQGLASLQRYAPDAPRRHEQVVGEAQVAYAHLVIRDGLGNARVQTFGPYLVDSPLTPDLIGAAADGIWYSHWLESGASLLSRERSGQGVHRLYGSWNADALQLTWIAEDGDWDVHGDLWFYFDTQAGGTTAADQPYPPQGWQDAVAVTLPFEADYLVHVRDAATAVIKQWNGSVWITATTMSTTTLPTPAGPPVYRLTSDQIPRRTDLYIPLGALGTNAGKPLQIAAFVANEAYSSGALPCLLVGAPDLNPLNCAADRNPLARVGDIHALTLTQALAFDSLPAGILPNAGRYSGAVPSIIVNAQPRGGVVGYLQSDRYDVLTPGQPIDADLDGSIDHPITGVASGVVGNGQTVTYTVVIHNSGDGAMPGVVVTATARGALGFGTPTPYNLGTVAPGQVATLTITATVNTALNPNAAELMLTVDDATHRPFEWFWVHHAVDNAPPQAPRIVEPLPVSSQLGWALALPLTNTVRGWVYDADVARLQLEAQPLPTGSPRTFTCPYAGGYAWTCTWDAGTGSAQFFRLRARAQDAADNWSAWSEPITVAVDLAPPQIALDAYTENLLQTSIFGGLNWPTINLYGVITDDLSVAGVLACRVDEGAESCQSNGALIPSPQTSDNWWLPYTIGVTGEGVTETVRFYAVDGAGNRSQPLTRTLRVDTLAPRLTVTQVLTEVWREDYTGWSFNSWYWKPITDAVPVFTGTLSEAALAWADLRIEQPDGRLWTTDLVRFPDGRWHGVPQLDFSVPGVHTITVRAVDRAGNWTVAGPFTLLVKNRNDAPRFITWPPDGAVRASVPYTYEIIADDDDLAYGDALTLTAPTLPGWLTLEDHGDGTATLSGTPTNADVGDHAVVLRVTDRAGAFTEQAFNITVAEKPLHHIFLPLVLRSTP